MKLRDFLFTHAGKGTVGVVLADLLIVWPDALSWLVAAAALVWAVGHFRESFRSLDAEPAVSMRVEPVPATAVGDPLDQAAALDMAARGDLCPEVIFHQEPAAPAARRRLPA